MSINPKYVPIIKWKKGEQEALKELTDNIKDEIIPLIEITPDFNETKLDSTLKSWENQYFYYDVLPECYEDDDEIYFRILKKLDSKYVIPVLELEDDLDIISSADHCSSNGFALRITCDDADNDIITDSIDEISKTFDIGNIDLILDMKEITNEKYIVVKSILSDINNLQGFRNIILSSSSFPETLNGIERFELSTVNRDDWFFWKKCTDKLNPKFKINLVYSDYGIDIPKFVSFIPGMSPLFKIRYTYDDKFIILKGQTIKKGGLDKDSVSTLCNTLVSSEYFKGKDFSWGDNYIFEHSTNEAPSYGNLTTWIKVGANHHITFVINQLSTLL